jgi:hypothetical protein
MVIVVPCYITDLQCCVVEFMVSSRDAAQRFTVLHYIYFQIEQEHELTNTCPGP